MTNSWFFYVILAFAMTILLFVSNYFIGTCVLACCTWCSMRWGAPPHAAYMQQAWRVACCIYAGTIIAQNIYYDFQCIYIYIYIYIYILLFMFKVGPTGLPVPTLREIGGAYVKHAATINGSSQLA